MARSGDEAVNEVFALLEASRERGYFGEQLTQLEHALQAAQLAQETGAGDVVVAAALLHDVGHLCTEQSTEHEQHGANYLRRLGFPESVALLVASHVDAKRYLTAVNPDYAGRLSAASQESLRQQGGPMTLEDSLRFRTEPGFEDKLRLRAWDEQAKQPGLETPPLESYRPLLLRVLNSA